MQQVSAESMAGFGAIPKRTSMAVIALVGEHPDEGTQDLADGLTDITVLVANEEAAKTRSRWTPDGLNMARVGLPADAASPVYEVRRMAEIDQTIDEMRRRLGNRALSLLIANVHYTPYPGNSALYAGDGDFGTCAIAAWLGFDRLVIADFPNLIRWGYDRKYDVKNVLLEIDKNHPLYSNPAELAFRLGWFAANGLPLSNDGLTSWARYAVQRYLYCGTLSEERAVDLNLPMYGAFERIAPEHVAALNYNPALDYRAVTWGTHFPGHRGEIVRRI
jgi:hypothetical protein